MDAETWPRCGLHRQQMYAYDRRRRREIDLHNIQLMNQHLEDIFRPGNYDPEAIKSDRAYLLNQFRGGAPISLYYGETYDPVLKRILQSWALNKTYAALSKTYTGDSAQKLLEKAWEDRWVVLSIKRLLLRKEFKRFRHVVELFNSLYWQGRRLESPFQIPSQLQLFIDECVPEATIHMVGPIQPENDEIAIGLWSYPPPLGPTPRVSYLFYHRDLLDPLMGLSSISTARAFRIPQVQLQMIRPELYDPVEVLHGSIKRAEGLRFDAGTNDLMSSKKLREIEAVISGWNAYGESNATLVPSTVDASTVWNRIRRSPALMVYLQYMFARNLFFNLRSLRLDLSTWNSLDHWLYTRPHFYGSSCTAYPDFLVYSEGFPELLAEDVNFEMLRRRALNHMVDIARTAGEGYTQIFNWLWDDPLNRWMHGTPQSVATTFSNRVVAMGQACQLSSLQVRTYRDSDDVETGNHRNPFLSTNPPLCSDCGGRMEIWGYCGFCIEELNNFVDDMIENWKMTKMMLAEIRK
ncbi:hypothetical protein BJ508DRAFT_327133 [Ascobolus immersus RN42]|uniref:Uncharacterized protein n=1 Tax=Ascobolus immersus RN42 TaxID=1160509 RepID=A0A3N4I3B5_ASCIM|nr:hypothetical protein BJ508DRAFT_327133 [Ascobolus immersus RN42]